MATDCELSINIKEPNKVNNHKILSLLEYLIAEKFLTLQGDFAISVDREKAAEAVSNFSEIEAILQSETDNSIYCSLNFTGEYGSEKHDNKLTDLVNEILEASTETSAEDREYTSACIYTASFRSGKFEIEEDIYITECGFFFGGDGHLDASAIAKKLQNKLLYSNLVKKLAEIFESEVYFDVQLSY